MPQLSVYYGLHWDVKVSQRVDFSFFLIIEVELIYNVVLGSGVQQSDSVLFIYLYFIFLATPCSMQDLSSPTRD